jgi:hypothetical protein
MRQWNQVQKVLRRKQVTPNPAVAGRCYGSSTKKASAVRQTPFLPQAK